MKRVLVNITDPFDTIPNIEELLPKEYENADRLKSEGYLTHLFVKEDRSGAILILNDVDIDKAKSLVATYPMSKYYQRVDYIYVDEQF